jgi:hypothetical protein
VRAVPTLSSRVVSVSVKLELASLPSLLRLALAPFLCAGWLCVDHRLKRSIRGHGLHGRPVGPKVTLTNEEWRINTQLRLDPPPLAGYHNQPHAPCPYGCRAPANQGDRQGTDGMATTGDCRMANQGNKSHEDVEATVIHRFNTYTSITATKAKPFPDGMRADILVSGITTIDNPAAQNWHLDITSTNPLGVTNQEFGSRAADPSEARPRKSSPAQRGRRPTNTPTRHPRGNGDDLPAARARDDGRAGASTAAVYLLFTKHMRELGLPADVLVGKLKKDTWLALRRGDRPSTHCPRRCPARRR